MNGNSSANDKAQQTLVLLERIAQATEANAAAIQALADELAAVRADLEAREQAPVASGDPALAGGKVCDFQAETIVVTLNEDGQPAYKVKGARFVKFGVRVWPEVLPALGVDPQQLKPGPNPYTGVVRALMNEEGRPKKVIGLAA